MKNNTLKSYISLNNKKYYFTLEKVTKGTTRICCQAANIEQEFLNEDVPELLRDLPNLVLAELKYKSNREQVIRFRVSVEDKKLIMKKANEMGFKTLSGYLRSLITTHK